MTNHLARKLPLAALPAVGLVLALGQFTPADAAPAAGVQPAATCQHFPAPDLDKTGSGHVKSRSGAQVRPGPNSGCVSITSVFPSVTLYYHCFVINSSGNSWTNVRIAGSSVSGWVYDGDLDDGGSTKFCGG
jgi:hypothetical protein